MTEETFNDQLEQLLEDLDAIDKALETARASLREVLGNQKFIIEQKIRVLEMQKKQLKNKEKELQRLAAVNEHQRLLRKRKQGGIRIRKPRAGSIKKSIGKAFSRGNGARVAPSSHFKPAAAAEKALSAQDIKTWAEKTAAYNTSLGNAAPRSMDEARAVGKDIKERLEAGRGRSASGAKENSPGQSAD